MCPPPKPSYSDVLAEARTWLGTPWHHAARVRGAGVDCAQFLIAVYSAVGLIEDFNPGHYPQDWHLHREEARFMAHLLRYADPVDEPQAADVAMFKYGRHAAHGGIVVGDGTVIHSWRDEGRVTVTELASPLGERLAGFYRLRGLR